MVAATRLDPDIREAAISQAAWRVEERLEDMANLNRAVIAATAHWFLHVP